MKALVQEEDDFNLPMTPMIDIVFQLLIFFLLATTITEEELDIQVKLPPTDTGAQRASAAGTRRFINVRKDSSVTLGGAPITWEDLKKKLDEDGKMKDKPKIYLRADASAPHGTVHKVLQLCIKAGLKEVNMPGKQEDAGP